MAASQVYTKRHAGEGFSFNLTPMIDVTFQLIIFFILAGQIASSELAQLLLPDLHKSMAMDEEKWKVNRIVINVVSQAPTEKREASSVNAFLAAQAKVYRVGGIEVDVRDYARLVQVLDRQKREKQGDTSDDEFYVEIRSDYRVSYAQVEPVMMAAAAVGFKKMNITALRELGEME